MPAEQADTYLIEAVQRGEPDAWREVISRYEGRLLTFARRRLAARAEAEDIVQETFLGLLRSIERYDAERSLETYLFAILRNKLNDFLRKVHRAGQRQSLDQLELNDTPDVWVDADTPSGYVARSESTAAQRRMLEQVLREWVGACCTSGRFQDLMIIEMLVVLGLRNKEVAADLELTEPAVAGVKFRALEQWRKLTQAAGQEYDWQESELAEHSTVGRIWQAEGVSCLKRTTLGRYLLGALPEEWHRYVEFHVEHADCERCQANLADLKEKDTQEADWQQALRERCFASSVGFLSRPSA